MKNVYILCEGQTEESFVNEVLYSYFCNVNVFVYPIVCTTKRTPSKKHKGGIADYVKVRKELLNLCKDHRNEYVTTMFDYYAMPADTPGVDNQEPDIYRRIKAIEKAINDDIGMKNCSFHFMIHEFEGILFSNPSSFGLVADGKTVEKIQQIRNSFSTPEHINNSPKTAPSKRLEQLIPNYAKVRNGAILSKDMGIDVIMSQCQHFREWVSSIISVAES